MLQFLAGNILKCLYQRINYGICVVALKNASIINVQKSTLKSIVSAISQFQIDYS